MLDNSERRKESHVASNKQQAIERMVMQHAEAWNSHDMVAYAALFTDDADLVNIRGGWWHGRAEIEERMTTFHKTVFRQSHLEPKDTVVRFLEENIAITHTRWELREILDPDGQQLPGTLNTITTWTMRQKGNEDNWKIEAFQNTEIAPPTQL